MGRTYHSVALLIPNYVVKDNMNMREVSILQIILSAFALSEIQFMREWSQRRKTLHRKRSVPRLDIEFWLTHCYWTKIRAYFFADATDLTRNTTVDVYLSSLWTTHEFPALWGNCVQRLCVLV